MYTQSYGTDREIKIPESYGGIAFSEPEAEDGTAIHSEATEDAAPAMREGGGGGGFDLFGLGKLLPKGLFSGVGFDISGLFSSFGAEELLLLGLFFFLFFSKGGDKECAIILLFLLFVHK